MSSIAPDLQKLSKFRTIRRTGYSHDQKDVRPQADLSNVRPCHEDRVLVRRVPQELESSVIILPNADGRSKVGDQIGIVVAVGPGASYIEKPSGRRIPYKCGRTKFDVQPGDKIVYERWPNSEFEHEGETYTFLYEEQSIKAVLE